MIYSSLFSVAIYSDTKTKLILKSAFIVKMTHFIQWPDDSSIHQENNESFTICINQSNHLNDALGKWAQSGLIKNKPVTIKFLEYDAKTLSSCDMLYITSNTELKFLLEHAKDNHTLTISDIPGNAKRGVLINFIDVKGKLRFEINLNAAEKSGFKINPRLLKLATIVNGGKIK